MYWKEKAVVRQSFLVKFVARVKLVESEKREFECQAKSRDLAAFGDFHCHENDVSVKKLRRKSCSPVFFPWLRPTLRRVGLKLRRLMSSSNELKQKQKYNSELCDYPNFQARVKINQLLMQSSSKCKIFDWDLGEINWVSSRWDITVWVSKWINLIWPCWGF